MTNKSTWFFVFVIFLSTHLVAQTIIIGGFQHNGLQRSYRVYVPSSYNSASPAPLVINLHGYGSNNIEQELYSNFLPIADTAGFIIVHPNGTPDFTNTLHWNTFGTSNVDDVGFLSALIDTLASQWSIDQSRVYATGMSNGGFMSFQLACQLGNRIAAIASVTGTMTNINLGACQPVRPMPIMQIHGTADGTVPYNGNFFFAPVQNLLNFWISYNATVTNPEVYILPDIDPNDGCTAERYTYSGGINGSKVIHYKIIGGGHSWPGAPININVTNMDFSASSVIWRFFEEYDINGIITHTNKSFASSPSPLIIKPLDNGLEAKFPDFKSRNIMIIDAAGRIVFNHHIEAASVRFNLPSRGLYLLLTSDGYRTKFINQ